MTKDELVRVLGEALCAVGQQLVSSMPATPATTSVPVPPPDSVKYMAVAVYAKRIGYSPTTVRVWIKAGLPVVRGARGNRVKVAAADEWIEAGGIERAAVGLARRSARKERRAS